jgi:hypothetical protein
MRSTAVRRHENASDSGRGAQIVPAHKILIAGLVIVVFVLVGGGCAGGASGQSGAKSPGNSGEIVLGSDGTSDLDLGQDWDQPLREPGQLPGQASPTIASTLSPPTVSEDTWALVLFTFTGIGHRETAEDGAQRIRAMGPEFASTRVHVRDEGSMIVLGSYPSRDHSAAQDQLDRLRRMVSSTGQRVFPRVMLTRLNATPARLSPYDLRTARRNRPGVRALYTVDIAVWSTFDEARIDFVQLKRQAEAYAGQLRAQGYEAYFFHNEASETSNVTIGVFGVEAYDAQSGIYSPDVQEAIRQFPARLNNGQPLQVPVDRFHPERGMRPQPPALVEIP